MTKDNKGFISLEEIITQMENNQRKQKQEDRWFKVLGLVMCIASALIVIDGIMALMIMLAEHGRV